MSVTAPVIAPSGKLRGVFGIDVSTAHVREKGSFPKGFRRRGRLPRGQEGLFPGSSHPGKGAFGEASSFPRRRCPPPQQPRRCFTGSPACSHSFLWRESHALPLAGRGALLIRDNTVRDGVQPLHPVHPHPYRRGSGHTGHNLADVTGSPRRGRKIWRNTSSVMEIVSGTGAELIGGAERLAAAGRICMTRHEKWDGNGYSLDLAGDENPLGGAGGGPVGRVRCLRSRRVCKDSLPHEEAVRIILSGDGRTEPRRFSPEVFGFFRNSQGKMNRNFENPPGEVTKQALPWYHKIKRIDLSPSPSSYRNFPRRRAVRVRPETGGPPVFGKEIQRTPRSRSLPCTGGERLF
ncbi:MAG: hypothetical protein PWP47_1552 [Synergistaceae bacterium]|nr:hypothetical protein [Synergistaceae bacterium]